MCPFCSPEPSAIVFRTTYFYAIFDRAPVSEGHLLIISVAHRPDIFALSIGEWYDLAGALHEAKRILRERYKVDDFNIGANCGEAAGQTVMHCHWHVIPRRKGDVANPRGGIRNLMPNKEELWPETETGGML